MKTRSRVIFLSVLAIACCMSLIAGATFALFTSESEVNFAATAGIVQVVASVDTENAHVYSAKEDEEGDLTDENGYKYSYEEQTNLTFKNGGTATFTGNKVTLNRITPGDKVTFPIKVINNDNVTAKYRTYAQCISGPALFQGLKVTILDEAFNLSDGIMASYNVYSDWAVIEAPEADGSVIKTVNITIEFPITAGNQYQGLSTAILYGVEAIQGNAHTEDVLNTQTSFYENLNENIKTDTVEGEDTVVEDAFKAIKMTVPKDSTDAEYYKIKAIKENDENQANFRLVGAEQMTYDIKLVKDNGEVVDLTGTDKKIKVELYAGLNLEFVAVFHNEVQVAGQEDYDPNTGYVSFEVDSFSPYTLAFSYAPVVLENADGTFKYYQKLQNAVNDAEEGQQIIVNYNPKDTQPVIVKDKTVEIVTANSIIEKENSLIEKEEDKIQPVLNKVEIFENIEIKTEGTGSVELEIAENEVDESKIENLINEVVSVNGKKFDDFSKALNYAISITNEHAPVEVKFKKDVYVKDDSIAFGESGYSELAGKNRLVLSFDNAIKFDLNGNTIFGRINLTKGHLIIDNGTVKSSSQALNIFGSKDINNKDSVYTKITLGKDAVVYGEYGLCVFAGDPNKTMYPVGFGEVIDIYGKVYSPSPVYVSGNVGMDTYESNIGKNAEVEAYGEKPSVLMAKYGPKVNVYDGALLDATVAPIEENPQGITLSGYIKVYVYGGEIIGGEGVGIKGGELHVLGGKITSIGLKKDPVQAIQSGNESSGAAISITSTYNKNYPVVVEIAGGEIIGTNNVPLLAVCSVNGSTPAEFTQGITLSIGKDAIFTCLDGNINTVATIANSNAITFNSTGNYVLVPVIKDDIVVAYDFAYANLNDGVYSVQIDKDITENVNIACINEGAQLYDVNYNKETGILTFKASDNSNCIVSITHKYVYTYTETTHKKSCDGCDAEFAEEAHVFVDGICECGYKTDAKLLEENGEFTCRIGNVGYKHPFQYGSIPFKTDAAMYEVKSGETIKMIADFDYTKISNYTQYVATTKTNDFEVTIDLNGKTLTFPSDLQLNVGTYNIIDSSSEKTGYVKSLSLYDMQDTENKITVNIYGGTFDKVSTGGDPGDKTLKVFDGAKINIIEVQGSDHNGIDRVYVNGGDVTTLRLWWSLDVNEVFNSELYTAEFVEKVSSYNIYNLVKIA